jgi:2-dehydro-3-deoxygluconokinase
VVQKKSGIPGQARDDGVGAGCDPALAEATKADLIVYSLITLAILPQEARTRLLALDTRVAFDGNYRPGLWPSSASAASARDAAIARASIGLPTLEDETQVSGESTAGDVARHWQSFGCAETVVKMGAQGCRLPDGNFIPPPQVLSPVDTSGAGDAFNAGYLHARLSGATPTEAANEGHRLAGWVVMRPGAIPPQD